MGEFTVNDWQQRLNALKQPVVIVGKRKAEKKVIFTFLCYKCGFTFDADKKALITACRLRENGKYSTNWCPICNKKRSVENLNDVATLRKDLIKYFVNPEDARKHSIGSHARVELRCPECGNVKTSVVSNLCSRGFYCDYCSDNISLGNKIIRNLVLQLPLNEYVIEYSDTWTQRKVYDCYFLYQGKKYLIEIDGLQHARGTTWVTKEEQQANDALKERLARENGYELIRIKAYKSDFEYIKGNILESKLSEMFDLSLVDWDAIHEKTITSQYAEMAKYYMEHKGMMMQDIAAHFNVSYPTLRKALEILAKAGLCDYSKEKAYKDALPHMVRIKQRDFPIFTVYSPDNVPLGKFKTPDACLRELGEELSFVGLTKSHLRRILYLGESFKGYRFEYDMGLYEYHKKTHPQIFEICKLFNEGHSVKEISIEMNISDAVIYLDLLVGSNMGICSYQRRDKRKVV